MSEEPLKPRKFRKIFSLRVRFSLLMAFFIVLVIAVTITYFIRHETNALEEEIVLRGLALANSAAAQSEEPLVLEDDLTLASLTYDIKKLNPGVVYAVVTDEKGIIMAHSDSISLIGTPFKRSEKVESSEKLDRDVVVNRTASTLEIEVPIMLRETPVGAVRLGVSKSSIKEKAEEGRKRILFIGGVFILIAIITTYILVTFVVRGLERVSKDIAIIGSGRLDHPVRVKGRDEVGMIAYSVREMAQELKKSVEKEKENIRFKQEIEIAQKIQTILLPKSLPRIPGHQVATYYKPALVVGGDYYDHYRMLDGKRHGLMIADVSGKGIGGSLLMVMLRTLANVESQFAASPKALLSSLHEQLAKDSPEEMFVTSFTVSLEPLSGLVELASAGHNPAVLYRAREARAEWVELEGPPLGIPISREAFDAALQQSSLNIGQGDVLVLYTDGVTEAMDEEENLYGEERLLGLVGAKGALSAGELRDAIVADIESFTHGTAQSDDVTLLVLKRTGAG